MTHEYLFTIESENYETDDEALALYNTFSHILSESADISVCEHPDEGWICHGTVSNSLDIMKLKLSTRNVRFYYQPFLNEDRLIEAFWL